MFKVDTLFVISSARGKYALDDLLASIRWTCVQGTCFTVVVDENETLEKLGADGDYQVIYSGLPPNTHSGFHRAAGLSWAMDAGIEFRQVIMLSDDCLIMSQGLDQFGLQYACRDGVCVLGVRDNKNFDRAYQQGTALLYDWGMPMQGWERAPDVIVDDVMFLSSHSTALLHEKNLLIPLNCEQWPTTHGAYVSWVGQMLGTAVVMWGSVDRWLPPLAISKTETESQPPPHVLDQNRFKLFSSVRNVLSYSESELRELYKRTRGEAAKESPKYGPVVAVGPVQT
jgi:hypothetical protein